MKDELCPLETGVQALNLHSRDVAKVIDNTRLALRLTCAFLRVEFERKVTTFLALINNDQPSNDLHWANRTPLRLDQAKLFWWWEPRDRERRRGSTPWSAIMSWVSNGTIADDPFRFVLVDEVVRGGAHSQTLGVTAAYDLHYRVGFRISFSLTVIDTPEFGDT